MIVLLPRDRLRTSASWVSYFRENATAERQIDWSDFPALAPAEARAIARSMAAFQKGEDGTGRRFLQRAAEYARQAKDADYLQAVRYFVAEEQRHAAELGRFLDLAGLPRAKFVGTDKVFRSLRGMAGLELIVRVLLTAETLAKVYYSALRAATAHPTLRQLCRQILRDEVAHVEFQAQRLAILSRARWPSRWMRQILHRFFYYCVAVWVWWTHRSVFRAANWSYRDYWRRVKRAWRVTDRWMRV